MREVALDIRGLGLILYSPPAVAHITEGTDYLRSHFWEPDDVARHVMEGQLTAFCARSLDHIRSPRAYPDATCGKTRVERSIGPERSNGKNDVKVSRSKKLRLGRS